jgi:hypothetical protein
MFDVRLIRLDEADVRYFQLFESLMKIVEVVLWRPADCHRGFG